MVLLDQPNSKLEQHCTVKCSILTRHDNRGLACLVLLCAKLTPFNNYRQVFANFLTLIVGLNRHQSGQVFDLRNLKIK